MLIVQIPIILTNLVPFEYCIVYSNFHKIVYYRIFSMSQTAIEFL